MTSPYKRMLLLPEPEYVLLKQQQQQSRNSETAADSVWPSAGSVEREQKLYALKLRSQREADDTDRRETPPTPTAKTSLASEVDHFPKTFQSRAKRLIAFLEEKRPQIQWNREGEVAFSPHGSPFSGSKISDLIYHATAILRRNFQPIAWPEFLSALRELNAPSTVLSNATLKEMQEPETATSTRELKTRRKRSVPTKAQTAWLSYD